MHTLDIRTPDIAEDWIKQFRLKTVVFYAYPLVAKWLKAFKSHNMAIVGGPQEQDDPAWQRQFKSSGITQLTWEDAGQPTKMPDPETVDCLVVFHPRLTPETLALLLPLLRKGGALLVITQNLFEQWATWQAFLEEEHIVDPFPVGFHPQGAIAWWPLMSSAWRWPGVVLDAVAPFFPGRYPAALRWGKCWMFRGFKRDEKLVFH